MTDLFLNITTLISQNGLFQQKIILVLVKFMLRFWVLIYA